MPKSVVTVVSQRKGEYDGHDDRSVISAISEGRADTTADLTSTMTSYARPGEILPAKF